VKVCVPSIGAEVNNIRLLAVVGCHNHGEQKKTIRSNQASIQLSP